MKKQDTHTATGKITNILFVSHFPTLAMGGQRSMVDLIANLDRSLFQPFCVVPSEGELSQALKEHDCPCFVFNRPSFKPKHVVKLLRTVRHIRKLIAEYNIHIVHSDFERDAIIFGYATRNLSTKAIWHCRVAGTNKHDSLAIRYSDSLIAISHGVKQRLKSVQHKKPIHVVYNGVDTQYFTPTSAQSESPYLALDTPVDCSRVVLFVGQMKRGKGIYELLACAEKLPMYTFVFIGAFPSIDQQSAFNVEAKQLGNVFVLPQQKNIIAWMQYARTLVLPSHEGVEGMGRVLFEAMACGIPVIGTDTSGVREVPTENTGRIVHPQNLDQLVNAVQEIVSMPEDQYAEMSNYARLRAVDVFDSRKHAQNVMDVYSGLTSHD